MAVAVEQQRSSLTRTLRLGDEISLDNGRVVVKLVEQKGRRATLNFQLDRTVTVDKPPRPGG
jgi:hypothetical protein